MQGMRFMPGDSLYQIADLSSVWVMADVYEQDIALVRTGSKAKVSISAYPGQNFEGTITYVYPTLKPETRTVPVRLEMANPRQLLKPAMFAEVELPVGGKGKVLTVPISAVIDSGTRQIVLVQLAEGRFEPREVKLGSRTDDYVEVMEGVKEGEAVVVSANFLIDAESNLKAAISGFGAPAAEAPRPGAERLRLGTRIRAGGATTAAGAIESAPAEGSRRRSSSRRNHQGVRREIGHRIGLARSGRHAQVAGHDDGLQGRERRASRRSQTGGGIAFEFVERSPGEWVITKILRAAQPSAPTPSPAPIKGTDRITSCWARSSSGRRATASSSCWQRCSSRSAASTRSSRRRSMRYPISPTCRSSSTPSIPGQAPQVVEDQVTYPLTSAMLSVPKSKVVRGFSFFGASFVYIIFEDGTDIYWARSRVLEYLNFAAGRLPKGVSPQLGPDATGVGWVFQYALVGANKNLAELRTIQDWYLRYQLAKAQGVAEVASIGGFVQQYQVVVDPVKLRAYGIPLAKVSQVIRDSNRDVGGRVVEMAETEYMVRGKGYLRGKADIESLMVKSDKGTPVLIRDIARVEMGPGRAPRPERAQRRRRSRVGHRDVALRPERPRSHRATSRPRSPKSPPDCPRASKW